MPLNKCMAYGRGWLERTDREQTGVGWGVVGVRHASFQDVAGYGTVLSGFQKDGLTEADAVDESDRHT